MSTPAPETKPTTSVSHAERLKALRHVLVVAVAAGLLTGLLHAASITVERVLLGRLTWFSREFLWMAPITHTLFMLAAAVPLASLAFAFPRRIHPSMVVTWTAMCGLFAVFLPYPQIGRLPALVLSAGMAVQLGRWAQASQVRWTRLAPRLVTALLMVLPVLALSQGGLRRLRERAAVAGLPTARDGAPNVLLIILDTVRASSLSLYGWTQETTPHLARWASEGTTFEYAIAPAPWTLPSHSSYFTGLYPGEFTADWTVPLDRSAPVLAEAFRDRGYHTSAFAANLDYTTFESGLARGFTRFEDYIVNTRQTLFSSSWSQTALVDQLIGSAPLAEKLRRLRDVDLSIDPKHSDVPRRADDVTRRFLDWQQTHAGRPFFTFLNYFDAHKGYYAPPEFHRFGDDRDPLALYHNAISWIDSDLDTLFRTLQERGVLDNTIVIVTADHGELLNEHGIDGHANSLYLNVLRVPLVIRFPAKVPANTRVRKQVSLRDLAATVADLADLTAGSFPGQSLGAAWRSDSLPLSPVLAEVSRALNVSGNFPTARGALGALFDDSLHYIRNYGGGEELFRYRSDPLELTDLAPSNPDLTATYRERLDTLRRLQKRVK